MAEVEEFKTNFIAIMTKSPREEIANEQVYPADFWGDNKSVFGTDKLHSLVIGKDTKISKVNYPSLKERASGGEE